MEWINVKDELPPLVNDSGGIAWSKKVLCRLECGNYVLASMLNINFWKDWENGLTIPSEYITHWMPLPKEPMKMDN